MCGLIFIGPKKSLSDGNHLNYGDFRSSFIKSIREGKTRAGCVYLSLITKSIVKLRFSKLIVLAKSFYLLMNLENL